MRLVLALVLVVPITSGAVPALAGHYDQVYSGGGWTTNGDSAAYATMQSGYGGAPIYYGDDAFADCDGTVTVTFTWVPDYTGDDPPASCIVEESCSASATWVYSYDDDYSGSPALGSADADCDMPGATPGSYTTSTWGDATSSGTKTWVKSNTGDSFTVICNPSAHASTVGTAAWSSVAYTATVLPVIVSFAGTTINGGVNQAIIGQGITAYLTVSPFDTSWYHYYAISNYSWTISGGAPFKHYYIEPTQAQQGHVILLSGDDYTQDSVHFYCRNDELVTVTCTADVYIASQTLHVTGAGKVTTIAPSASFEVSLAPVTFYPANNKFYLGPVQPDGTPILFTGTGVDPFPFYQGSWHFVQLVKPSDTYTSNGVVTQVPLPPKWGVLGLDATYPYAPAPAVPADGAPGRYPCDNLPYVTQDSPAMVFATLADLNAITHITIDRQFNMYMMYLPPGSDVEWVSAYRVDWSVEVNADEPDGDWRNWAAAHGGSTAVGTTDKTVLGRWHVHPEWDIIQ